MSARHEAGNWNTLGTISLPLEHENSHGTLRYGNVLLEVPLASGSLATNVELRVWQRIADPLGMYVSARHEAGSWNTLGTIPLPLDQVTRSGTFRYGDISFKVPLPSDERSPSPAATGEPTPEITTIHVPRGDGIELVFVGSGPPVCLSAIDDGEWTCVERTLTHAERRAFLTAEMAKIAAFFAERFGVAPPAQVTVLLDISGISGSFVNQAFSSRGTSEPGTEGFSSEGIIMAFGQADSGALYALVLAHEYYHVLQFHLAESSPYTGGTPGWLVEGSAEYASKLYAGLPDAERRAELAARTIEDSTGTLREDIKTGDWYALGALAVDWLTWHAGGDAAHVQYWRELASGAGWEAAFEAAFRLTPDTFYDRFEAYRPEAVKASRPHLADDITEPIVVTVGDVPREVEARIRSELARRQRAGDVADFTVYLADTTSYPAISPGDRTGRRQASTDRWTRSSG
ncbi:MAG: hypothetical protein OXH12_06580 [Chloroflexi bacterium]|nr:hypothetical protein [Chloroflexota bacterium]